MKIQLAERTDCPKCHGGRHPRVNCERCSGEKTVPGELDVEQLIEMVLARLVDGYTVKRRGLEQIEESLDARCRNIEERFRILAEQVRCTSFPRGE